MAEKREILQELGEENLLLPASINAALKANDRIKYFFTLLQAARNHADNPGQSHSNLRAERESVGITDPDLDTVVGGATIANRTGYAIPLVGSIFKEIITAVEEMISPLALRDPSETKTFEERFARLRTPLSSSGEGLVSSDLINAITITNRVAVRTVSTSWSWISIKPSTPCRHSSQTRISMVHSGISLPTPTGR